MGDVLIKRGRVADGSGSPWFRADVLIENGTIAAIAPNLESDAETVIDAADKVVSPGFIDIHTHSDLSFLVDPAAESKLRQGVTTEVVGNCGMSTAAPLYGEARSLAQQRLRQQLPSADLEFTWSTMGEYLDRLEKSGLSVNLIAQVGHGTVRACVMGMAERPPTDEELSRMKDLVSESLGDGALGMSLGLYYAPGSYADTDEAVELSRTVAARGGFVSNHLRDESIYNIGLLGAVDEFIEIGRRAEVPIHIAHLKCLGPAVWGQSGQVLERLDEARHQGVDVTADQYPYLASGSSITGALVPRWAQVDGREQMLERLRDGEFQARVRQGIEEGFRRRGGAERLAVASFPSRPDYEGKTMAQLAEENGLHPADLALEMLRESDASFVSHVLKEEDMLTIASHPAVMVASDGSSLSTRGPTASGRPHPRHFGTFPRVLGQFVRGKKLYPLEEAVRRMTSFPAQRIGLKRRGLLREGYAADVTVFDPETVEDRATFERPQQYPVGIDTVLVNGEVALARGEYTGALAGKPLRDRSQ